MANELQIGQIVAQVEYSTTMPGASNPAGPEFPAKYWYDISGGPRFSTSITKRRDGSELRYIRFSDPIHRYDISGAMRTAADLAEITDIYRACYGQTLVVLFKDPFDYTLTFEPIGVTDGSISEFQVVKRYEGGGRVYSRDIINIVPGTMNLYYGSTIRSEDILKVEGSDYGVNYDTGKILFGAAPDEKYWLRVSCEFYTACRFDVDSASIILHGPDADEIESLSLVEVRS